MPNGFGFTKNAGEDITKDPPVSIPNTVVKLCKPMVISCSCSLCRGKMYLAPTGDGAVAGWDCLFPKSPRKWPHVLDFSFYFVKMESNGRFDV